MDFPLGDLTKSLGVIRAFWCFKKCPTVLEEPVEVCRSEVRWYLECAEILAKAQMEKYVNLDKQNLGDN